jgi:hypothetical protein
LINLDLTSMDYTYLVIILTVVLACHFCYHVMKRSEDMKEIALVTLFAEVSLFLMWLALCGLHNIAG